MTGPSFSPDGQWMWDGNGWIPAPPQSNVLPQQSINQQDVSSVATQTGVDPNQLTQAAPYFDQNQDGVLQQSELQQAAMAISQSPTAPVPVQGPPQGPHQGPPQGPHQGPPQGPHQPAMQQPAMQQPAMQQNTIPMGQAPQQLAVISTDSGGTGKIIAAFLLVTIILGGALYVWIQNLAPELTDEDWDYDGDGFLSSVDNCWDIYNPEQLDFDNDMQGDECDVDDDNDGIGDLYDVFPKDSTETEDSDGDGVGDNADVFPNDASETMDSDNDGVGDNADTCDNTPEEDDVDSTGCTLVPDADADGVNDDQDLLVNGNAGLRIYISQLSTVNMEFYEDGQDWPCTNKYDSSSSVEFEKVNDGTEDCTDGSDENNMRYPDWAYRLRVDWNCDEIYDDSTDLRDSSSFHPDLQVVNISLNAATDLGRVISKDISENLEKVCISVAVYDYDIIEGTYERYDIYPGTGDAFTLNVTLSQTKTSGEFSFATSGNNDDDDSYPVPDASVTIRFLIYEVTD